MKLFLKKFLAAVLALTMVLGVFPLSVFAEGANAADTSSTGSSSLSESGNAVTTVGGPSAVSEEGGTSTGTGEIPVTKDIAKLITGMVFTGAVSPEYKNGTYYVKAGETYKVQVTFKERDRVTDSQGNITTEGLEFDMSDTVYFEVSGDKPGLVTMRTGSGRVDVSVTDSDTGAVYHIYHDYTVDANKVTIDWNESNPHFAELKDAHSVVFYFNLDVTFNGSGYQYVQVGDQLVTIYIDDRGKAVITKQVTPTTLTLTENEKQAMEFQLLMEENGSWVQAKYRDDDGNLHDVPNFTYDQFETDQGNNTQSFTVENLEPGKNYKVVELSRPNVIDSYLFDSNQSTTEDEEALSAGGGVANMALTNDYEPAKGNIEITKSVTWNEGTGTPSTEVPADQITNIWFAVFDSSNEKVGDYNLSQFTYDEQAKVYTLNIPNLPLDTYTVQEQNNINGYTWTATVNSRAATPVAFRVSDSVTLDANGETEGISFGNNYEKMLGDLTIKKTTNGATTPANTKFTVKNSAGTVVKSFTYSDMTNGEYTITGLPAGEYTVTEDSGTAQVSNYKLNVTYDQTDGKYTVEDDKTTTANVTNNYTPLGTVRIEKNVTGYDFTVTGNQQNRKNIIFRLYKINDDGSLREKYGEKTYNDFFSNGYVNWTDVPVGKYALVEFAPDIEGYELTTTPNDTATIGGKPWPQNTRSVQILEVTQGTTATAKSTGVFTNTYKKKQAEIVLKKDFGANSKYTLDNWSEMSDDMLNKTVYEVHDNNTGKLVATYTLRQVLTAQAAGTPITYEATPDHYYWFKEAPVLDAGLKVSVVCEWGVETLDDDGNVTGTATPFETKACSTDDTGYMSGVKKIEIDNRGTITFINTYEYDGEIKGDKTITGVLSEQEKAEVRDNLRFTIYQQTGSGEIVWKDNVTLAELEAGIKAPSGTYRVQEAGSLQPNNSTNYIIITNSQVENNDRIVSSNTELFQVKKNSATTVHFYNDYGKPVGPGGKFGLIKYVRGLKEITGTEDIELKKGYTGDLGTVVDGLYDSIRFEIWKKATVNGVEQEMTVGEYSLADFLAGINLPVGSYRMKEKGGELTGYWWHAEFIARTGIANYTKVGPTEWTFDITENGLPQIELHNVYGKVGSLKITKDLINNTAWPAPNMAITVKGPLEDGVMPADPQINQTFHLSDLTMETGTGVNGNGYYTYTLDRLPIGTYEITETDYTDINMNTWAKTTVYTVAGGSEQPQTIPADEGGISGTVTVSETGTAVFGFKNQYDPDGAELTLYKEFGAGNELDPDTMTDEQKRAIKFQLKENSVGKVLYEATFADFTKDAQGRWTYTFTGLEAYTYYLQEVIDQTVLPEAAWNWTAKYYQTNWGENWYQTTNPNVGCTKDNPGRARVENTFKKQAQLQLEKVVDLPAGTMEDWSLGNDYIKMKVEGPATEKNGKYSATVYDKFINAGNKWTSVDDEAADNITYTSPIIPISEPGWYKITEGVPKWQWNIFSYSDKTGTTASVDGGAATVGQVTYIQILEEDMGSTTVHRVQYTNVFTQEAKLELQKQFTGDETSLSMSNKPDKLQCFRITVRNENGDKIKADGTVDNSIPYTLTVNDMSYGGGLFKKEIDDLVPGKYTITETLVDTNGEILSEYTWAADATCNSASCKNGSESTATSLVTNKLELKGNKTTAVLISNNLEKLPDPEVQKSSSDSKVGEITDKNGVKYPVWRFTLDINNLYGGRNVKDGTFTMEDVFDTNGHSSWFRVATKAELQAAGLNDPYLNNSYTMVNKANGETHDPLTAKWNGNNIVVTGYKDGELYTKYEYTYYLVIKDEQSFIEFMKKDPAATTTLQRDFYNEISYPKNGFKPDDKTQTGAEYTFKNMVVYKDLMNLDPDTGKLYIIDDATGDKIEVKRARYFVVLNENAETLGVSAAGTYPATLKAGDTFSANQTVIPTSVKVTPSTGVSYVLDNDNHTIEFIIPNSTRVEIEYETTFTDAPAGENPKLKNEMKLEGYGDGGEDEINYSQEGGGGGTIYTVKILKHENGDQNNRLKGAVFGLYHEGGALETTVTTDEDGVATIRRWETGENSLFAGKNYYLQEIQQPTGYQLSATKYPFRFESSAPGYPMILPGDVILAPNTPEVTGVSGQKTWSDNNNANGNRPTSITVQLSAVLKSDHTTAVPLTGNLTSISQLTVTQGTDNTWDYQDAVSKINGKQTPTPTVTNRSDDEWHYAWTNLPTYLPDEDDKQVEVEYKITEVVPDGYKATYNGNDILNTEGKVDVSGKKTWGDDDAAPANRTAATKVKVTIKAVYTNDDGDEVDVTAKALPTGVNATIEAVSPDYEYKWEDLPVYVDGRKVTYSVSEEEIPGYTGSKGTGDYDIHNAPNTVKLDGEKIWDETTDKYKNRPTEITINLKAKDEQGNDLTIPSTVTTKKTVKKDVNGDWKWSFTGLPEYIGGKKAVYYVEEESVPGYDVSYNTVGDKVTVTNTPKKTNVKGEKTWNTGSVQVNLPARIYVTISAKIDGTDATATELKELLGNQGATQSVTPDSNNVWEYEWTDLPTHYNTKAVTYSVKETPVSGFTSRKGTGYNIINTPDTGEISGSKTWSDNDNAWENRPAEIIITLKAMDDEGNPLTLPSGIDNPKKVTPDSDGNWAWNWGQLPKYIGEEKATYYVEETAVPGYDKQESGMDVTNTPKTTTVSGEKTWAAGSNKYNQQPTSIEVTISAKIGSADATADELKALLGEQPAKKTVSTPWSYSWTNLPTYYKKQQVTYSVTETPITGYTASKGTGDYDIENTPEYVTLSGSKTWDDSNNALKNRPTEIVITLKARVKTATGTGKALNLPSGIDNPKTVSDDGTGKWAWTWEDLPKYIGEDEAEYYVEETAVDGYTKTESGMDVTNTPAKTTVSGEKTWAAGSNKYGQQPNSIEVTISAKIGSADATATELKTLLGSQDASKTVSGTAWSYSWTNLPTHYNKQAVTYSVTETPITGYTVSKGTGDYDILNTPEYVNKDGKKTWTADPNNELGNWPTSIKVTLHAKNSAGTELVIPGGANGVTTTQETTAAKDWEWSWKDLPKFLPDNSGTYYEAVYYVEETLPAGYTKTENGMDVSNTPATTTVSGTKTWAAGSEKVGIPTSIKVTISAETSKGKVSAADLKTLLGSQSAEKTVSGTAWTYEWTNLPTHFQGKEVTYSVTETPVAGFKASKGTGKYDIKNTPETDGKSGSKTWTADPDNEFGNWPTSITITLKAKDAQGNALNIPQGIENPKDVTADDDWSWSWTDLPKYIGDKEATYYVEETLPANSGYIKTDGVDMNVSNAPETVNKSGSKTWNDSENAAGNRPTKITITLKAKDAQGKELTIPTTKIDTVKEVTPDTNGNWSWSWNGLPKYLQGKEATYYVEETAVKGYDKTESGMDVSNTPKTTNVNGEKTWSDNDNALGNRPASIWITLKAKDAEENALTIPASITQKKEVKESDDWKWSWTDLPAYLQGKEATYYVEEDAVTGYNKNEVGMNVENTPVTTSVSGEKTWATGSNKYGQQPNSITVTISAKIGSNDATADELKTLLGSQTASKTVSGTAWSYSWTNLPTYYKKQQVTYSVTETPITGYKASKGTGDYDIENTPEYVTLSGSKTWDDSNNALKNRPTEIVITLKARVKTATGTGKALNLPSGIDNPKTVSDDGTGKWAWTWEDLPKYIGEDEAEYYVEETLPAGYTKAEDGMNVTNTPATTEVKGTKTWAADSNKYGQQPTSIEVTISAKIGTAAATDTELAALLGSQTAKKTVSGTAWSYSWTNLPTHYNKQAVTYTVTETVPAGYEAKYDGYNVENTPLYVDKDGAKTWADDPKDELGNWPAKIEVTLHAKNSDGKALVIPGGANGIDTTQETTKALQWKWSWEDLPKFLPDNSGTYYEAIYYVVETAIDGYEADSDEDMDVTNTPKYTQVSGEKTWNDDDNKWKNRPTEITINLEAKDQNGADLTNLIPSSINKEKKVSEGTDKRWTWSWTNLPEYLGGKKATYYVTENTVTGYTKTETGMNVENTPETTEVPVTKNWDDNSNQYGTRPTEIKVNLIAKITKDGKATDVTTEIFGGAKQATVKGTAADKTWSYTFKDLPKYYDGQLVDYSITEEAVQGYNGSVQNYTITNTPALISKSGEKTWSDNNNALGNRPEEITITLKAKNAAGKELTIPTDKVATQSLTINEADHDWKWTFSGLPISLADENGTYYEAVYYVEETLPAGYTKTENGMDVTNTPATTTVSGKKTWAAGSEKVGIPTSIKVTISAKTSAGDVKGNDLTALLGSQSAEKTVSGTAWTYEWTNLPTHFKGKEVTYSVTETPIAGFEASKGTGKYDIKNTPETDGKSGSKTWTADPDNEFGNWPTSITITLKAKDSQGNALDIPQGIDNQKIITEDDGWSWSWTDLPKYIGDKQATYYVEETLPANSGYIKTDGVDMNVSNAPETVNKSGSKTWNDSDDAAGNRPTSIWITLKAKDAQGNDLTIPASKITTRKEVKADSKGSWTWSWNDLPKYLQGKEAIYYVVEDAVTGYDKTESGMDVSNTPKTTKVDGQKTWSDSDNAMKNRPTSIWITLKAKDADDKALTIPASITQTKEVKESDGWKWSWTDLPAYLQGKEATYYVEETAVAGYNKNEVGMNVTNTPATTEVKGTKTWDDKTASEYYGQQPTSITVTIKATTSEGDVTANVLGQQSASQQASSPDYEYSWTGLPTHYNGQAVTYSVSETPIPGYTASAGTGTYDIVNTPEFVDASGSKTWDDSNDALKNRPTEITVTLKARVKQADHKGADLNIPGSITTEQKVTEKNGKWEWSWENLPKYIGDKEAEYYVVETLPTGYTKAEDGMNVKNTPATKDVTGVKTWNDQSNKYEQRPTAVTVTISAKIGSTEATADELKTLLGTQNAGIEVKQGSDADNWSYGWTNLPTHYNKQAVTYSVTETEPAGYTGSKGTGDYDLVNTPQYVSVDGSKQWDDNNDKNQNRPTEIKVTLSAKGKTSGDDLTLPTAITATRTVKPDTDGNWSWSWSELPKFISGEEAVYSVTEQTVTGYIASQGTGTYDIKNTPETCSAKVIKVWDDNENQDGARPAEITVTLKNSLGETVATVTLPQGTAWEAQKDNLPVYKYGKKLTYSWYEDEEALKDKEYTLTNTVVDDLLADDEITVIGEKTTLTNTYKTKTTSRTVKKVWDDKNDQDGVRPTSLTVKLQVYNTETKQWEDTGKSVTLPENGKWEATINNLDLKKDGVEIKYRWSEESLPTGYILANTEVNGTITTLTNKRETEKVAAKVVKEWSDENDRDGKRPKQLVVELLADGNETGKTVTLEDGKWEATITGLEKNRTKDDDTEKTVAIEYTWKEKNLPKDYKLDNTKTKVEDLKADDKITVIGKVTTLTNTHELEKTKVTVIKVWEDDKNRDGKRPASITVELKADGQSFTPKKTVTLDDNNQWTDSIDGLDKYREGKKGELIEYTWDEGTVGNGYTLQPVQVDDTGYITTLTNKRETEKVAAKVIKVWDDDNNRDNKRPTSITVKLLADKVDTGKTVTLPKNGKWEDTIEGLDKYKAGQVGVEIEYTWEEVLSSPYYKLDNTKTKVEDLKDNLSGNITVNGSINGTVIGKVTTLTNTHETLKVAAEVKKVWLDENNRDGKRPTSIEVELLADGASMNPKVTVVLNDGNGWTQTVSNLPAYKTGAVGQAITYSWSEGTINNGYSLVTPIDPAVITKDQNGDVLKTTITLKNSRDTEKVDVEVYKLWEDDDNRDGLRPASLTVELLADNRSFSPMKTVTLNAGNDWHGTIKGLDKYKAGAVGQLVKYTWREVNLPASYSLTLTETDTTGYITTLTNTHVPEKTTAEVKKVWKDAAAKDMVNKRPTEIKVELLMDGKSFSPAKIVTLKGNQWSYTEKDLLKYRDNGVEIKYTWVETAVPAGYILESNVTNAKVTTITNKATEVNIDKVDITGEKELPGAKLQVLLEGNVVYEWTSTDKPHKISGLDTDVTYTLHEEVGPEGYKVTGDTTFTIGADGKVDYKGKTDTKGVLLVMDEPTSVKIKKVDITDQHELEGAELWIYDSKGKAVTHWISEKTEKEIKNLKVDEDYTLVEKVPAPGYTVTTSTSFRIDKYGNVTYTGTTQQPSGILLVEDAPTETYVTKLDEDGYKLPGALLQILNEDGTVAKDRYGKKLQWTTDGQTVMKIEGLVVGKKYILHEAKAPETYKQADDIVFTLNPDGTINAKGHVDQEGTLFMVDMLLRGSVKINKEFIFTFQPPTPPPPSPETVNIPVTKVWKDNNNKDGNRPIAIVVHLLADGERVLTGTVTAADNWKYTFEGMPMKNADGKTIRYTVEEEPLFGYSSEITGSASKGYRLVNTYVPATTQISVQKNWDDDNNKAGLRPDKLLVRLSTGKVVELNEKNRWRATVDGLPAFENGMPIRYSWVEESVPGYRQVGVLFLNNTYIFTNRLENPPEDIEEPPTPKGVDTLINHVGDCFD